MGLADFGEFDSPEVREFVKAHSDELKPLEELPDEPWTIESLGPRRPRPRRTGDSAVPDSNSTVRVQSRVRPVDRDLLVAVADREGVTVSKLVAAIVTTAVPALAEA